MFVVLGASGNTGKVVAETLLRQKKKVRVVLHRAKGEFVVKSRVRTHKLNEELG